MSLTVVQIKNVKPAAKPQKLFDGNGLYLNVSPAGSKSFRLKYRFGGREKIYTIGLYPTVSLLDAREQALAARRMLLAGLDPSDEKQKAKEASCDLFSFEFVAREWHENKKATWAERHAEDIMERLEKNIFPYIGKRTIKSIDAPLLLEQLRRIEARGSIEVARRVRTICSQVFRYAISSGRADRDPAADIQGALKTRKAKPRAAITHPKQIGELLRAIDALEGTVTAQAALLLTAMTWCRPGEVQKAEWSEFNLEDALWTIPASRMKPARDHLVPLPRQAVALLRKVYAMSHASKYVFPSCRTNERSMSDVTMVAALRRVGYGKDQMCAHGFRAMGSTISNEHPRFKRFSPDAIEMALSHITGNKVRAAYNRALYLDERRELLHEYADFLNELREFR